MKPRQRLTERAAIDSGRCPCAVWDCPLLAEDQVVRRDAEARVDLVLALCFWHAYKLRDGYPDVEQCRCLSCNSELRAYSEDVLADNGHVIKDMRFYECTACDQGWERGLYYDELGVHLRSVYENMVAACNRELAALEDQIGEPG